MADLLSPIFAKPDQMPVFAPRIWEDVLGQARRAQLVARLAEHFNQRGWMGLIPEGPRSHVSSALWLVDRQRHEVLWEAGRIRSALLALNTPIVLLKGAAYLLAGLPPAAGRLFSDIDIMVAHDHIERVESALFAAGWISDERDAYNQRYYRQWMHEIPPLRHIHRLSVIDLHHTITPPTSRFKVSGQTLLTNAIPLDGNTGLYVLAPVDMVLHSAVHLFLEGEFDNGLRDLLDIRDLLRHFERQPQFWPELITRAKKLGLGLPLHTVLFHIHRLLAFSAPPEFQGTIDQLGPHGLRRALMARLFDIALRPNHPSCTTPWSGFARWLLYVRSHYLRMPLHQVVTHLVRKAWIRRFPAAADAQ